MSTTPTENIPDCPMCQDNLKVRKLAGKWHCDTCHGHPIEALPDGHLYHALNNLLTHLGLEGSIDADHGFVWDTMTALKRIDGGVYLDNLAVPTEPDAHRDDMLAAVRMLEDGEWAEHFAKTPIGKRLEDGITKLHSELNDRTALTQGAGEAVEPVADHYRNAIAEACEGWTMSEGLRKHLETALWNPPPAPPAQQLQQAVARAADVCDSRAQMHSQNNDHTAANEAKKCAAAIRSKGTHD